MAEPTSAGLDFQKVKPSVVEEFVAGAKKGFYIGAEMIAPAMVLAFVLIQFLNITGLMTIVGQAVGERTRLDGGFGHRHRCQRP